ncbi:MAG: glycosyltransferase family 2 protein [Dehalococcoidia bacterium]|nr:glycosyltransferase family 2 protein [Dehalococcoidia bacterium]
MAKCRSEIVVNENLVVPAQGPSPPPKIVAAIPCYNEERCIGSVVIKTKKYVNSVVVIDDGSSDSTVEVASGAGALVRGHIQNRGYGVAIRSALAAGRELDADILVILDGDGQHDPAQIPGLLKPILDGEADMVVGSRFLDGRTKSPLYRRFGQRVLNTATAVGSGQSLSDSQSGFRAYSAKALEALSLSESGMAVSSELQFAAGRSGLRVTEVPISVSYEGELKRSPIAHGVSVLTRVTVLFSLRQPLVLFGLPGFAMVIAGLIFGARVLTIYSNTRELALGNALGTILLTLAGLLAIFAALMLQAMKELMRGGAAEMVKEVKEAIARKSPGKRKQ